MAEAAKERRQRRELREGRERMKTLSEWLNEAQAAVNAYVRERDRHLPCISCGRLHNGKWNAGHYLSRGARPELRFDLDNIHRQCEPCNSFKSGNATAYRIGLIARIGIERVERLEGPHPPARYTVEDAKRIKAEFRTRLRGLLPAEIAEVRAKRRGR